jgi:hypothetical protein
LESTPIQAPIVTGSENQKETNASENAESMIIMIEGKGKNPTHPEEKRADQIQSEP